MDKIKKDLAELLDVMENATIGGDGFIRAKVNLQTHLLHIIEQTSGIELVEMRWLTDFYVKWRQLGSSKGTIRNYLATMDDLRNFTEG